MICGSSKGGGGSSIAKYLKDEKEKHRKSSEFVCDFRAYGMDGCRSIDDGYQEMVADYLCKPEHYEDKDPFVHLYMRLDPEDKGQIEAHGEDIDVFLKDTEDDLMNNFLRGQHKSVSISHKDEVTGQTHRHMMVSRQNFVTNKMELNERQWKAKELRPFIEQMEKKYAYLGIRMTGSNSLEGGRSYDGSDNHEHHYNTQSFRSYTSQSLNSTFLEHTPKSWKDFHQACHKNGFVAVKRDLSKGKSGLVLIDKGKEGKVISGGKVMAFGPNSKQDSCSLGQLQKRFGNFQAGKECGASYEPQHFYDKEAKADLSFKSAKIESAYKQEKRVKTGHLPTVGIRKDVRLSNYFSFILPRQSKSMFSHSSRIAYPSPYLKSKEDWLTRLNITIRRHERELKQAEFIAQHLIQQGKVSKSDFLIRQSAKELEKSKIRDRESNSGQRNR